jgi:hypothetical protein
MIVRIVIALVGALAVTCALLLGMDAVTTVLREEQSGPRMYRISDVIRRDRSGRQDIPDPPIRLPALPAQPGTDSGQIGNPGVGRTTPNLPDTTIRTPPVLLEGSPGRNPAPSPPPEN